MTTYGTTHVITAGSPADPVLLLLHGTADNSAMMWVSNIEQLSERFYVIAIDAIGGSGKSEPNERYANEFDQTAWLDELLDAMKIETACVAGVSYGAYLAYHYAIWRPARVTKIVCMAGRVASSQFEVMSKMIKAFLPEALFPTEASCRRLLRKLSANCAPFENNPDLMNHWHYLLKHFNNKSMMKHAITIFTDEQLESIRGKALFLIGEQDILSNYPKAIRKLEQIRLNYKIIRHAGHAINHEQPEKVNREIIEYLRKETDGEAER
ncbi:alpha/beta fold hydrolase [Paenibacillus thiaminolyticus]|uniref:alpha/beta fold hydrolase n=2 Tax=Paenibacillus thiaminolyticus TaxID=49283 RepID=UPI002543411C|nr:alpha/beta hydrolase [Paenibacillus thiaminolyticus]WII39847.1 alpha/beta hydrolase [Paenibacillus thiaminolyticus]